MLFEELFFTAGPLFELYSMCGSRGQFFTSPSFCFFQWLHFPFSSLLCRGTAPIHFSSDLHTPLSQLSDSLPHRNLHSGEKHLLMTAECCGDAELRVRHCKCLPYTAHLSLLATAFLPPLQKRPDQPQNTERCCFQGITCCLAFRYSCRFSADTMTLQLSSPLSFPLWNSNEPHYNDKGHRCTSHPPLRSLTKRCQKQFRSTQNPHVAPRTDTSKQKTLRSTGFLYNPSALPEKSLESEMFFGFCCFQL